MHANLTKDASIKAFIHWNHASKKLTKDYGEDRTERVHLICLKHGMAELA